LSPISTSKLFAVVLVCAPQLAIAFVWENNDEKRGEWKKIVASAFLDECQSDPSESCLKASSLMQLTRDVCGRVPPGVNAAVHRDILRDSCLKDAQEGVRAAAAAISEREARLADVVREDAKQARMESELRQRNAYIEAEQQRRLEKENKDALQAQRVRNRDLAIEKAREEREALMERSGVKGVLVDIFVALSLLLALLILNFEAVFLKIRGVRNDQT